MNNGYYLHKTGNRVNELLERHFIVPTLDSLPGDTTLSWIDNGYTVLFRVGELCRVLENDEYKFYRLRDIQNNKADWVEANSTDLSSIDLSNYYTKSEIDDKLANIEIPEGDGSNPNPLPPTSNGVTILTKEEYEQILANNNIVEDRIYFVIQNGEPLELYIGNFLIGQKGELGDLGFPYTFPIIF